MRINEHRPEDERMTILDSGDGICIYTKQGYIHIDTDYEGNIFFDATNVTVTIIPKKDYSKYNANIYLDLKRKGP